MDEQDDKPVLWGLTKRQIKNNDWQIKPVDIQYPKPLYLKGLPRWDRRDYPTSKYQDLFWAKPDNQGLNALRPAKKLQEITRGIWPQYAPKHQIHSMNSFDRLSRIQKLKYLQEQKVKTYGKAWQKVMSLTQTSKEFMHYNKQFDKATQALKTAKRQLDQNRSMTQQAALREKVQKAQMQYDKILPVYAKFANLTGFKLVDYHPGKNARGKPLRLITEDDQRIFRANQRQSVQYGQSNIARMQETGRVHQYDKETLYQLYEIYTKMNEVFTQAKHQYDEDIQNGRRVSDQVRYIINHYKLVSNQEIQQQALKLLKQANNLKYTVTRIKAPTPKPRLRGALEVRLDKPYKHPLVSRKPQEYNQQIKPIRIGFSRLDLKQPQRDESLQPISLYSMPIDHTIKASMIPHQPPRGQLPRVVQQDRPLPSIFANSQQSKPVKATIHEQLQEMMIDEAQQPIDLHSIPLGYELSKPMSHHRLISRQLPKEIQQDRPLPSIFTNSHQSKPVKSTIPEQLQDMRPDQTQQPVDLHSIPLGYGVSKPMSSHRLISRQMPQNIQQDRPLPSVFTNSQRSNPINSSIHEQLQEMMPDENQYQIPLDHTMKPQVVQPRLHRGQIPNNVYQDRPLPSIFTHNQQSNPLQSTLIEQIHQNQQDDQEFVMPQPLNLSVRHQDNNQMHPVNQALQDFKKPIDRRPGWQQRMNITNMLRNTRWHQDRNNMRSMFHIMLKDNIQDPRLIYRLASGKEPFTTPQQYANGQPLYRLRDLLDYDEKKQYDLTTMKAVPDKQEAQPPPEQREFSTPQRPPRRAPRRQYIQNNMDPPPRKRMTPADITTQVARNLLAQHRQMLRTANGGAGGPDWSGIRQMPPPAPPQPRTNPFIVQRNVRPPTIQRGRSRNTFMARPSAQRPNRRSPRPVTRARARQPSLRGTQQRPPVILRPPVAPVIQQAIPFFGGAIPPLVQEQAMMNEIPPALERPPVLEAQMAQSIQLDNVPPVVRQALAVSGNASSLAGRRGLSQGSNRSQQLERSRQKGPRRGRGPVIDLAPPPQ